MEVDKDTTTAEAIVMVHEENVEIGRSLMSMMWTGALWVFIFIPIILAVLGFIGKMILLGVLRLFFH